MKHFLKSFIHSFNFVCMCTCEFKWLSRMVIKVPECTCLCLPMTRFRKMCLMLKSTVYGNHNKKWFREANCLGLRVSSLEKQAGDPEIIISTQNWTHKQNPYSWHWWYMAVLGSCVNTMHLSYNWSVKSLQWLKQNIQGKGQSRYE